MTQINREGHQTCKVRCYRPVDFELRLGTQDKTNGDERNGQHPDVAAREVAFRCATTCKGKDGPDEHCWADDQELTRDEITCPASDRGIRMAV